MTLVDLQARDDEEERETARREQGWRESMRAGSAALAAAMKTELGKTWACGHDRTWRNTQTVAGVSRCRECRRERFLKSFYRFCLNEMGKRIRRAERRKVDIYYEHKERHDAFCEVPIDDLVKAVAGHFYITPQRLKGQSRSQVCVHARAVVCKIMFERGYAYSAIKRAIGRSDHSTAINAVEQFPVYAKRDPEVAEAHRKFRDMGVAE